MKRTILVQFGARVRMVWLVATVGLAGLLATALLFGIEEMSAARAASYMPPSVATSRLPTTPTLVVGTSPSFWPMEYMSGTQIVGHDIDLMNAVAVEMGVTAVYTSVPSWDEVFDGLIAGEHDAVISTVSVTPSRQELVDFTLPYVAFRYEGWEVDDNIAIVVQKDNRTLRRQINEALLQLHKDGTLAANVAAIAADMPEWQPHLADWPYVPPGTATTLAYTDTEQVATIIQVPGEAVTETLLLVYTPVYTATAPSGFSFANRAFDLDAYRNGVFLTSGIRLSVPATVTIHYTETDVMGLDEGSLVLGRWNEAASEWEEAADGSYDRHPEARWLAAPVRLLGQFALFGEALSTVYLPLIERNYR